MLVNYGALNSSSIRDTYERDFYLLKNVIKQHDNVIECVVGRGVPCTHTLGVCENAVEYAGSSACVSLTGVVPQVRVRLPGRGAGRGVLSTDARRPSGLRACEPYHGWQDPSASPVLRHGHAQHESGERAGLVQGLCMAAVVACCSVLLVDCTVAIAGVVGVLGAAACPCHACACVLFVQNQVGEPRPLPFLVKVLCDVGRGLLSVRANRVLHMDLKAANVVLDWAGPDSRYAQHHMEHSIHSIGGRSACGWVQVSLLEPVITTAKSCPIAVPAPPVVSCTLVLFGPAVELSSSPCVCLVQCSAPRPGD